MWTSCTYGSASSFAVTAWTALRVRGASTGAPETTATTPADCRCPDLSSSMPRADSDAVTPPESDRWLNTETPTVNPSTSSADHSRDDEAATAVGEPAESGEHEVS